MAKLGVATSRMSIEEMLYEGGNGRGTITKEQFVAMMLPTKARDSKL